LILANPYGRKAWHGFSARAECFGIQGTLYYGTVRTGLKTRATTDCRSAYTSPLA